MCIDHECSKSELCCFSWNWSDKSCKKSFSSNVHWRMSLASMGLFWIYKLVFLPLLLDEFVSTSSTKTCMCKFWLCFQTSLTRAVLKYASLFVPVKHDLLYVCRKSTLKWHDMQKWIVWGEYSWLLFGIIHPALIVVQLFCQLNV